MVVKKDGRRVPWDREKILGGLERACFKRPIPESELIRIADEVEEEVKAAYDREVPSTAIGQVGDRQAPPARPGGVRAVRQRVPAVQDAGRARRRSAGRDRRPALRRPAGAGRLFVEPPRRGDGRDAERRGAAATTTASRPRGSRAAADGDRPCSRRTEPASAPPQARSQK